MYYVAVVLLVLGLGLLVVGYRKTNRNMLATAAIVLLLSGSLESLVTGFIDGASASVAETPGNQSH